MNKVIIPKKVLLFIAVSITGFVRVLLPLNVDADAFREVKSKWLGLANSRVECEKTRFLDLYGLTLCNLNNQEVSEQLRSTHDQMVQEKINFRKRLCNQKDLEMVQKIANKVFIGPCCNCVEVIDDSTFELGEIGVVHFYATKSCYVRLNVTLHVKNLHQLESIFLHEYSHVLYEDNFNKELMQCIAWVNSQDKHEEVACKSYPFCRSFETRADVFSVINSSDHGEQFITFLKGLSEDSENFTHPKLSERINLLEQIKSELDSVEFLKND